MDSIKPNLKKKEKEKNNNKMCKYNHVICQHISNIRQNMGHNKNPGVSVIIFVNYYGKGWVALLGEERGGDYAGQFSICSGKLEPKDKGCFLKAALRELCEEQKICLTWQEFDTYFKLANGHFRFIMSGGTPVFIGIKQGQSSKPLNQQIRYDLKHSNDPAKKEISRVKWFWLTGKWARKPTNKNLKNWQLSSYAYSVLGDQSLINLLT